MDDDAEEEEERFTITLKRDTAWMLRAKLTLGPRFSMNPELEQNADSVYELRGFINDALVSLHSNTDRLDYPISINEDQAWIIDQIIDFDGGGDRTKLLMQVIRGLWGFNHGIANLPVRTNKDPWGWVTKKNSIYLLPSTEENPASLLDTLDALDND